MLTFVRIFATLLILFGCGAFGVIGGIALGYWACIPAVAVGFWAGSQMRRVWGY